MKHIDYLINLGACQPGIDMASKFPSLSEAWEKCEHPPYMFWLLRATNQITKEQAVDIAIKCAERVLPIWENKHPDDLRPKRAIEAAKAWLKEPTEENRLAARVAADAAAACAAAYADACACAAYAAADACAYAADAAAACAYAADAYADACACAAAERKAQAEIIRSVIGNPFTNL